MNRKKDLGQCAYSGRKSKYTGVFWHRQSQKWEANFQFKGIKHSCGFWDDEIAAARARDRTIIRVGGDLRKLQVLKPK